MRLLIIRHGDPDYSIDSLTEKGRREAFLLSERLARENISEIYCSPLGRAKATARYTAARLGLETEILNWLTEFPAGVDLENEYIKAGINAEYKSHCPWNTLPQYWTLQDEYFDRRKWREHIVMKSSNVPQVYDHIGENFDNLMGKFGYIRKGQLYDIAPGTDETRTAAFFCHMGLGLALLAHICSAALPFMWESFFLPTSSVTTVLTEKHMPYCNQAVLRIFSVGDTSHLYAGSEPVSWSGLQHEIK